MPDVSEITAPCRLCGKPTNYCDRICDACYQDVKLDIGSEKVINEDF